ncbi:MAG: mechanosensitive ion channel family protein [Candidatus Sericytochromatia bacterium]|nr:mechanosensitive ion channel family protein [Candidatus Sericytochromatia bacterium]
MSDPTATLQASGALPLLAPEVTALLTGQTPLDRQLAHEAALWLWQAAWSLVLIGVLAWAAIKTWDWLVTGSFGAFETKLPDDAARRLAQRIKTGGAILRSVGKASIVFIAVTMALARLGVNVAPVLASAGIIGLAVGFGAQSLVKDVISGFFIIMEDQYGVGDVVEAGGHKGLVERMNLRITQLRSSQGAVITLPNGQITTVVNHSKQWARAVVDVAVPLHVTPGEATAALQRAAAAVAASTDVLEAPEVAGVETLKEDGYVIRVQFKTSPLAQWRVARAFRAAAAELTRGWRAEGAGPGEAAAEGPTASGPRSG